MTSRSISVWYDPEGDFLEVTFERKAGLFRETESSQVMKRVDIDGNVIGFHIVGVSKLPANPFEFTLSADSQPPSS